MPSAPGETNVKAEKLKATGPESSGRPAGAGAAKPSNAALAPSGLPWVLRPSRTSSGWFPRTARDGARSPAASLRLPQSQRGVRGGRARGKTAGPRKPRTRSAAPGRGNRKQAKFPPRRAPPPEPPSRESSLARTEISREPVGPDKSRDSLFKVLRTVESLPGD